MIHTATRTVDTTHKRRACRQGAEQANAERTDHERYVPVPTLRGAENSNVSRLVPLVGSELVTGVAAVHAVLQAVDA